jgi:fructose 1,6-bisphosphatase
MGEFEPARLTAEDMDYSAVQQVQKKLKKDFTPV